jgi:hypothetical protein
MPTLLMPCLLNILPCPGGGGQQNNEIAAIHTWNGPLAVANGGSACGTRMAIKETFVAACLTGRRLEFLPIDNPVTFIDARRSIHVEKGAHQNACCKPI